MNNDQVEQLCDQLEHRPVGTTAAQMREAAILIRSLWNMARLSEISLLIPSQVSLDGQFPPETTAAQEAEKFRKWLLDTKLLHGYEREAIATYIRSQSATVIDLLGRLSLCEKERDTARKYLESSVDRLKKARALILKPGEPCWEPEICKTTGRCPCHPVCNE